jgi:hypothetical protein
LSLIEIKKKLLMAQGGGLDVSDVFNTSLWTGNGAARTITTEIDSDEGALVWVKARNSARKHILMDTVRGQNYLSSDSVNVQSPQTDLVTGFSDTGYSLGGNADVNIGVVSYVGWQFRRAPKFFDIVPYTGNSVSGRQIAHNLGVKPGMIIVKCLDNASEWSVYHQARTAFQAGELDADAAFSTGVGSTWNNTEPTETDFSVGNSVSVNASGATYIAYLFAHDTSLEGIIQCGSYVGNGSATGPIVNLGWKPQYLMVKAASGTGDWFVFDNLRGVPPADPFLRPNATTVENSNDVIEYLSTGFQLKIASTAFNASGVTFIYMAIREAA